MSAKSLLLKKIKSTQETVYTSSKNFSSGVYQDNLNLSNWDNFLKNQDKLGQWITYAQIGGDTPQQIVSKLQKATSTIEKNKKSIESKIEQSKELLKKKKVSLVGLQNQLEQQEAEIESCKAKLTGENKIKFIQQLARIDPDHQRDLAAAEDQHRSKQEEIRAAKEQHQSIKKNLEKLQNLAKQALGQAKKIKTIVNDFIQTWPNLQGQIDQVLSNSQGATCEETKKSCEATTYNRKKIGLRQRHRICDKHSKDNCVKCYATKGDRCTTDVSKADQRKM